jgi:hypothetical protein
VLAHTLERHGIATVQLASIRSYPERIRPPRALYCEFPLGRPLGKPGDAAFQRRVLEAALALLERPEGPVLEDFPVRIEDAAGSPLTCSLPPRYDPDLHPAVDEARALRPAYERQLARTRRTTVGQAVDADGIPEAVAALVRIADRIPLEDAGLPGTTRAVGLDVRAYYEEAAVALADHVPDARQAESWLYTRTETGAVLLGAQAALREGGAPEGVWRFLLPSTQQRPMS